jgi:hypothetical protein
MTRTIYFKKLPNSRTGNFTRKTYCTHSTWSLNIMEFFPHITTQDVLRMSSEENIRFISWERMETFPDDRPKHGADHLAEPTQSSMSNIGVNFFNSHSGGWNPAGSTRHVGHWLAYCTCPGWLWWWRIWSNEDWQGNPKYCSSVTVSTTNPTWPDPGSNPGRRFGKPATNRISYGTANIEVTYWSNLIKKVQLSM